MLKTFEKDMSEVVLKSLVNAGVVGFGSKMIFEESGQVTLPLLNTQVDVMIPIMLAGALSSVAADTLDKAVIDRVDIPIASKRVSNMLIKAGLSGGALAASLYALVGLDDLENVVKSVGFGAAGKLGSDYIVDNVILRSKQGFLL